MKMSHMERVSVLLTCVAAARILRGGEGTSETAQFGVYWQVWLCIRNITATPTLLEDFIPPVPNSCVSA